MFYIDQENRLYVCNTVNLTAGKDQKDQLEEAKEWILDFIQLWKMAVLGVGLIRIVVASFTDTSDLGQNTQLTRAEWVYQKAG